ncbi:hypothetical protein BGW39_006726 [Mortierella sp. 14UC]|nr:hypothetical protein BGW39_006726 [Mortierella sp. 14UC]
MPTKTRVLIVGGGLGGLILAILLQRAGIYYLVLEQSVLIRPIGSVIALSPLVLPLMEQLGLLEEIKRLSKPFGKITVMRDDLSVVGMIVGNKKNMDHQQRYGHYGQCITRPDLYNILLSKIPKERLHLGKRFVNSQNMIDPVTGTCLQVQVRCSDGSLYAADVLVGADGASSAVRQTLFRQIKEQAANGSNSGHKPLPKQDQEEQQYRQVALVGVTNPLNLRRYPDLQETFSQFKVILSRTSPYMSWFMPILGNRYCWLVTRTLEKPVLIHSDNSRESEWGPDATDEMSKAVRHLKGPDEDGQGTVGDLIDATDRQLISKVMLEERVFKTWYGGRTVLLGDARNPVVREVVDSSSMFGALLVKDGWLAEVKRKLVFAMQDSWMGRPFVDRAHAHRIQATFLKLAPDRGTIPPSQSQVQLVHTGKKEDGGEGEGRGGSVVSGSCDGEEEDRYMDMDSSKGRRRLDVQLYQLQLEQSMQGQQDQQELHGQYPQSSLRNPHEDLHPHHHRPTHQQHRQDHAQVDEFMTGQSSAIAL